ncbi:MAG: DNA methyltransferase [Candidatus Bathyarchaeia archaeon]
MKDSGFPDFILSYQRTLLGKSARSQGIRSMYPPIPSSRHQHHPASFCATISLYVRGAMISNDKIGEIIEQTDSPAKIYSLFEQLGYPKDKLLTSSYKRKLEEFGFGPQEREKIRSVYTVFNLDGKLQIFLVETKVLSSSIIRYITKKFSDFYLRFLIIFTSDFQNYTFAFPEFERAGEGKHRLKITKLNFDRTSPYYTDLLTIRNLCLTGEEQTWRDIWFTWKEAFSVEKVTDEFFNDYKGVFFELRRTFEGQKIPIKRCHELSQQFLNRLMFLYFISKKRWLNDDPKFIRWFWLRYREELKKGTVKPDTFYEGWLKVLYLEVFNNQYGFKSYSHLPPDVKEVLSGAPFLNGGLFRRNELDDLNFYISDRLFEKAFNFFEKYNFTIREDLPLDVEVAVDPKMIGYVYESLSNVAEEIYERQDLGIFYTPVVEVDFMCRRALVEYLGNHLSEIPKEWLYRLIFDDDKKEVSEFISRKGLWYRLEELLDNLAIVDPACGSGAFLVGMLNVLTELYNLIYSKIKREMSQFELKKKIIGNSLYGVDVMPWAVHSAELRLWLQLIIEEDIPFETRKLYPLLPNLNLKLRVGDSLVQELGGISFHLRDSNISSALKRKLSSLKIEKEKYYNNDPTGKFKTPESLMLEEVRIFGEIMDERILLLQKEIQSLEVSMRRSQGELFGKERKEQGSLFEEQIKQKKKQIEELKTARAQIQLPEKKPFVWEIDFAEVFGEKGGFDIVIGNPPYVRQEKIAPPNMLRSEVTNEDKKEYKDKLLKSIQVHYPFIKKIDKRSDYYVYFYFHGLSLLNEKGTFCFITSNSWLDVRYGKDLQEFLLKYCPIKAIYDNEARRSFEHADVNTVIALFGAPVIRKNGNEWTALKNTARFVMFKKPFEDVINTKNLIAIEKAETFTNTESYRVYPVKQERLLEEGWEIPEGEESVLTEKFSTGKYIGNKWGGKYLRAPEIYWKILEKGKGKLVRLGDIAEVRRGFTTGANEFFYLKPVGLSVKEVVEIGEKNPDTLIRVINGAGWEGEIEAGFLKPVIKSPRELKTIVVRLEDLNYLVFTCHKSERELRGTKAWEYIKWGERQGYHRRPTCTGRQRWWECPDLAGNMFWLKETNDRLGVFFSTTHLSCDCRLYYSVGDIKLQNSLNSTLFGLISEILTRSGLGEGAKSLMVYEVNNLLALKQTFIPENKTILENRELYSIFTELGFDPNKPIREQEPNPLPDRKALDDIVFDALGLTDEERKQVYWAVAELVKNRLEKARSV